MRAIFSSLACSFLYAFLRILFVSTYAQTPTSFLIKSYFLSRLVVRLNSFSCAAAAVLVPWIPWCSPFFFCTAAFCAAFSFLSVHFFLFQTRFKALLIQCTASRLQTESFSLAFSRKLRPSPVHFSSYFSVRFFSSFSVHIWSLTFRSPQNYISFLSIWFFFTSLVLYFTCSGCFGVPSIFVFSFISLSLISQPKTSERANEKLNTRN